MKIKNYLKLENLIYLAIFLLPTYLIRFKFFSIPTNVFEIIVGIIFILWISRYLKIKKFPDFEKIISRKYRLPIFLILSGLIISTFSNPNIYKGLGIIKSWFLIPIIFVFVAVDTIEKEKIKNIFTAYYFSAFAVVLVSIFYILLGSLTFDGRLEAFFNSPNYLAMYLAPALIIASDRIRNLRILSILIILIAFYLTYSYAAWLAVLFSIMAVFLMKKSVSFKKIMLILAILFLIFFSQLRSDKMNSLLTYDSRSSLSSRIMIWKSSEKILKDNWIIGIGPANFQDKYLEYQKYFPLYLEWAVPHPHNIFLAFWLSGGILGIIGFLTLIFLWFKETLKKDNSSGVKFIVLGIMLYILIHGLFDTTYFKNDLAVVFWLNFLALKI